MRTTVTIEDEMLADARELTGIKETGALVREAIRTLLEVEAGRRLIEMGGTMPELEDIPRRRQDPE